MYFPRYILPLGAAIEALAAAGRADDPADALRSGALIAQGLCARTGRISPIPMEAWRRAILWGRDGKPLAREHYGGAPKAVDPFWAACRGHPIPVDTPPAQFPDWVYAGIARADIEKPSPAKYASAVEWMEENVKREGVKRWKRREAIEACPKATGCTAKQAEAAWNALPPEIKGTRGQSKDATNKQIY